MFKAADTDGDGEISLDEFKTIMRAGPDTKPDNALVGGIKGGIGGATNLVGGAVGGAADLAKKGGGAALDGAKGAASKVGDVSKGALEATLKTLGGAAAFQSVFGANIDKSDHGLEKAFKGVDTDSSGKISAKEMNAHITKVYGSEMDPSIVEEMFKVADKDGDGEVDLDEFKAIMRAGPDTKPKAKAGSEAANGAAVDPTAMTNLYMLLRSAVFLLAPFASLLNTNTWVEPGYCLGLPDVEASYPPLLFKYVDGNRWAVNTLTEFMWEAAPAGSRPGPGLPAGGPGRAPFRAVNRVQTARTTPPKVRKPPPHPRGVTPPARGGLEGGRGPSSARARGPCGGLGGPGTGQPPESIFEPKRSKKCKIPFCDDTSFRGKATTPVVAPGPTLGPGGSPRAFRADLARFSFF